MTDNALNRAIGFLEAERNRASHDAAEHFTVAIEAMEILLAEDEKSLAEAATSN